jgi:hypothetical protein
MFLLHFCNLFLKKYFFISLLCIFRTFDSTAQDSLVKSQSLFEPYFNISSALSRAVGNNFTEEILSNPNAIGFRFYLPKADFNFRFGTNFMVTSNSDLVLGRDNEESVISLSLGLEKYIQLSKKFDCFYGFELRYFYLKNSVTVFDRLNFLNNVITYKQKGPGVAPLLGVRWNINDRVSLLTEGYIALEYLNNSEKQIISNTEITSKNSNSYRFNPIPPGAIVLSFKL